MSAARDAGTLTSAAINQVGDTTKAPAIMEAQRALRISHLRCSGQFFAHKAVTRERRATAATRPLTRAVGKPAVASRYTLEPSREQAEEGWPAPGSEDTELGVLMELEVRHGEASVYA